MNEKLALPEWLDHVAVFDTETTGLVLDESRIVTAALHLIDSNGNVIEGGKDWLINPGVPIPEAASKVHKVYDEDVVDAQDPASGVAEIVNGIQSYFDQGIPVLAYNAPYDFTILHYEALRYGVEPLRFGNVIDPLVIDRTIDKWRKGKRTLGAAAERYGVNLENAHTAADDAIAAGQVGLAMMRFFQALNDPKFPFPETLEDLHDMQAKWSDELEKSYAQFRQREYPDYKPTFGWPIKKLD